MHEKRRWGRVKVDDAKLTCRIIEPQNSIDNIDYVVDNINPGGICFLSDRAFDQHSTIKFLIKFPFSSYVEAGGVWGKVSYCLKIHDQEKYITGIAFMRRKS